MRSIFSVNNKFMIPLKLIQILTLFQQQENVENSSVLFDPFCLVFVAFGRILKFTKVKLDLLYKKFSKVYKNSTSFVSSA